MNSLTRKLVLAASLLLIAVYFLPLWKITLNAPQYPEKLSMTIWVNKLKGDTPHTIKNINLLNHYIGMHPIQQEEFPELRYMPFILAFLIITGVLVYFLKKKWMLYFWVFLLIAMGIAGMYDFYQWEYQYGHNLDPRAPIKIPGMTYQPPFIGTKQLLNISATSMPSLGGIALVLSILIAMTGGVINLFKPGKLSTYTTKETAKSHGFRYSYAGMLIIGLFLFNSCNRGPQPIQYGNDNCRFCKMTITDKRYGTEYVTQKGKVFKFDSIECLAKYLEEKSINKEDISAMVVTDFSNPGTLIHVNESYFLQSKKLPSPMGMYLTAFGDKVAMEKVMKQKGGKILTWKEVKEFVKQESTPFAGSDH